MTRPTVEIEYCRQCRWLLRAAWMAQELLSTFEDEIAAVTLRTGTGGIFDVRIDGETVWSRKGEGRFPDIAELKGRVRDIVAPVVGPGPGLRAPVLDDLEMLGLARRPTGGDLVATALQHLADDLDPRGLERPVLAGGRDDGPPGARCAGVSDSVLGDGRVPRSRLLLGPRDGEREILEGPEADPVACRDAAVEAVAPILDLAGGQREALAREHAVHDGRDPPAGDRVLAQLEQALAHAGAGTAISSRAARSAAGSPAGGRLPSRGASRPAAKARANTVAASATRSVDGRLGRATPPPARWTSKSGRASRTGR